jgi:hypothetical protein
MLASTRVLTYVRAFDVNREQNLRDLAYSQKFVHLNDCCSRVHRNDFQV